jgi:hypothetical protein
MGSHKKGSIFFASGREAAMAADVKKAKTSVVKEKGG